MKKIIVTILIIGILCSPLKSLGFTRIVDLIFNGESVDPEKLEETLETVKQNKKKNKKTVNPKKKKPTKLTTIYAMQSNPQNIEIEVDTSGSLVKGEDDIQAAISNQNFLNAITNAVNLWGSVETTTVMFAPLKFASVEIDPEDGKNVISSRAIEAPEGVPEGAIVVSIINYARSNKVVFMNKVMMVKPGTILDTDIIFDPTNDPCLALHTTVGDIVDGGSNASTNDGGIDPAADLSTCTSISAGDVTDLTVRSIANLLGLESSAIASAATSQTAQIMTRYALTNDDRIGLTNLYPKKDTLTSHGSLSGKVLLEKVSVRGAHVVLEDADTGEPTTSAITDLKGKFIINAIPTGTYNVYVEPVDGPIRKNALFRNFFGFTAQLNFTTMVSPIPVVIEHKKKKRIKLTVDELSASAFNINHLTSLLTEEAVNEAGGGFLLPITIMPGETQTNVLFWGSNISPDFGTLSVSGSGVTVSNQTEDKDIFISPFLGDPLPQELPGISVDITCAPDAELGPRNIIFTGSSLDETHPSFGLRDQITGGLFVVE